MCLPKLGFTSADLRTLRTDSVCSCVHMSSSVACILESECRMVLQASEADGDSDDCVMGDGQNARIAGAGPRRDEDAWCTHSARGVVLGQQV